MITYFLVIFLDLSDAVYKDYWKLEYRLFRPYFGFVPEQNNPKPQPHNTSQTEPQLQNLKH